MALIFLFDILLGGLFFTSDCYTICGGGLMIGFCFSALAKGYFF